MIILSVQRADLVCNDSKTKRKRNIVSPKEGFKFSTE
jgi:hypothetical protein